MSNVQYKYKQRCRRNFYVAHCWCQCNPHIGAHTATLRHSGICISKQFYAKYKGLIAPLLSFAPRKSWNLMNTRCNLVCCTPVPSHSCTKMPTYFELNLGICLSWNVSNYCPNWRKYIHLLKWIDCDHQLQIDYMDVWLHPIVLPGSNYTYIPQHDDVIRWE